MQGSKKPLIVVAAATVGLSLGGCTVNNYPAPPSPGQQQEQQQRSQAKPQAQVQAQAVQSAKPAPAPAPSTRNAAAPAPQQSAQPAPAGRTYTIRPGDNLWNIAKELYGDGTKYQRILDANPGLNPDNMKPGTKIVVP